MLISAVQRNVNGTIGYMSDFFAVTAATEQAAYPASNLLTPDLSQKWVSWGQRASHNWIEAVSDSKNEARVVALAGLLGIDRTNPTRDTGATQFTSNTYRMIIDRLYPVASRRRPALESGWPAGGSLVNLTGAVSLLNGPIDPPDLVPIDYVTTKMSAISNAANTMIEIDFYNYNATERPLAAVEQSIRVHYVHSNSAAMPTLEFKLRYNGSVFGAAINPTYIEKTSEGWMFNYSFDAADLPALTGRVGVQVTGTSTGSSTPVPIGVEWVAELQGWGTDGDSWDSNVDELQTNETLHYQIMETPDFVIPATPSNHVVYVYFEVSDWSQYITTGVGPSYYITDPFTPLGGHENAAFYAGRLVIAEGIEIGLKPAAGYNRREQSDVGILRTRGGTFRGARNPLHWNEHDFNCRIQAQSRVLGELQTLFDNAGMRNALVIITDESVPSLSTVYVILTRWDTPDVGSWVEPPLEAEDAEPYYDLSFTAIDARAMNTPRR